MYIFWHNVFKFPKFFISTLLGFFLTISSSLFKLLKRPKHSLILIITVSIFSTLLLQILKLMLALD